MQKRKFCLKYADKMNIFFQGIKTIFILSLNQLIMTSLYQSFSALFIYYLNAHNKFKKIIVFFTHLSNTEMKTNVSNKNNREISK